MVLTETGKRKAATLLKCLDKTIVSELLKELSPEMIQQLTLEMAQIESSGRLNKKEEEKVVREFSKFLLRKRHDGGPDRGQRLNMRSFVDETLVNILDKEKVEEIQSQVKKLIEKRDPFEAIHSATVDELVLALEDESPEMVALILLELEPKKIREILLLMDRNLCRKVVWSMTKPPQLGRRVKENIASAVTKRLKGFGQETVVVAEKPKETLRNVALILSDTEKDLRAEVLDEINSHDEETAAMVRTLMITWEDIPTIADRSLQEGLRAVEIKKLSIAMYQADEEVTQKIRSNISARVIATLDEETMLMQEPLENEVLDARESVVDPLRKANEEGTLRRVKQ